MVEHPAPVDSVPPPVHRVTARMFIRAQTPISLPSDTEVARLLSITTPPPSPLSSFSSPLPQILSPLPQILSPPLLVSSLPLSISPTYPLRYRAGMIRLRAETPSTFHPLPSSVSEVTLPPRKRSCIALGPRYEVDESSSAPTARPTRGFRADYGFGTPAVTDVAELSQRMTNFVTTIRHDTYELYRRLDDAHDDRLLMSGQLIMLRRDKRAHARTARLMETEDRLSREAWVQSMDASDSARFEVSTTDYSASTTDGDCRVVDRRPHPTGTACGDTNTDEDTANTCDSTPESAGTR
ncbi:hypothetical protein Tco_1101972 [Tanacetum coccineum]